MFPNVVSATKFTTESANDMFAGICAETFRNDVSMLTTLRILLVPRKPEDDAVVAMHAASSYDSSTIDSNPAEFIAKLMLEEHAIWNDERKNVLHIHSLDNRTDAAANQKMISAVDSCIEKGECLRGFKKLEDVSKAISNYGFAFALYLNEERKSTLVLMERIDMRRWHLLQSFSPRFFPWYFKEAPFTPEELELLKSLLNKTQDEYLLQVAKFAEKYDFDSAFIRKALQGFEGSLLSSQLEAAEQQRKREEDRLIRLRNDFSEIYRKLDQITTRQLGIQAKMQAADTIESDVMEYFLSNKHLKLVEASGSYLRFEVHTVIDNFDPEMYTAAIKNDGSFFYQYTNDFFTRKRVRKLFDALFDKEILKLRVCACYSLDFTSGAYDGVGHHIFDADTLATRIPNWHIQEYRCLGGNEITIAESVLAHNYLGAVLACEASARNMNMTDSTVGRIFARSICRDSRDTKILQTADGTLMSPREAIEWLEKGEK